MAKLVYNSYWSEALALYPEHPTDIGAFRIEPYSFVLFHDDGSMLETLKLLKIFGFSGDALQEKELVIAEDVNPWLMKLNNSLIVYFGEDLPVIKSKTIKKSTPSYRYWTRDHWAILSNHPTTYYYAEVQEPDLLFCFGNTFTFDFHPECIEVFPKQYLGKYDLRQETRNAIIKTNRHASYFSKGYWFGHTPPPEVQFPNYYND